ncbi:MAG: CopD family protein [Gammaproteobacteria bacterium]|jgi:copper transport protein|nr:CopD family protein [Gammaproteobacteria bacterium]
MLIAARAIYMLSLLLCAGGAMFILVTPAAAAVHPQLHRHVRRMSFVAAVAGLVYLQTAGAAALGSSSFSATAALQAALGSPMALSIAAAIAGLALVFLGQGRNRFIVAAGLLAVVSSRALTGHPAERDPAWLLMPAMAIHVACAAFWYGSLWPLLSALRSLRSPAAAQVLREFSGVAMLAVAALVLVGMLTALVHLTAPSALLATWYGQLLIMKSTWFSVLLALAAWHKLRLSPRVEAGDARALRVLRASIVVEMLIMALVVLISVNLASTEPEAPPRNAPAAAANAPGQPAQLGRRNRLTPSPIAATSMNRKPMLKNR